MVGRDSSQSPGTWSSDAALSQNLTETLDVSRPIKFIKNGNTLFVVMGQWWTAVDNLQESQTKAVSVAGKLQYKQQVLGTGTAVTGRRWGQENLPGSLNQKHKTQGKDTGSWTSELTRIGWLKELWSLDHLHLHETHLGNTSCLPWEKTMKITVEFYTLFEILWTG